MLENEPHKLAKKNVFKYLFFVVITIAILEAGWIYLSSDLTKSILLPPYSLTDSVEGLITASGSWISTTELANPIQTIQIECWKDFGHCWIMDSSLSNEKYLSLGSSIEKIAKWTDEAIETVPSTTAAGCVEYFYRIDRRSRVVTSTRRTVDNKTGLCEGIQKEPIIMHLGNGLERLKP